MKTEEAPLPDNVVSLSEFRNQKIEKEKLKQLEQELLDQEEFIFDSSSLDSINEMCTETMNELFHFLEYNYDLNVDVSENVVELVLFLESYKSLILKSVNKSHPFQDLAEKMFTGMKLKENEDGTGFKYVFENLEKI